ncbi:unnamed protein product [Rodentolepis nana]|uniref:DUF3467 domain-containing protein n=1 Tax=Rodentolepis nana TaxID=102285 RepID=A0A0R3TM07_RODNA|nr:unnamed protein product [Rodentolepis nana]
MSVFEEPLPNYSTQITSNCQEIVIPLREVTYYEKRDEKGEDGIELSIAFSENPLKHIPPEFNGQFREIMTNSSWDWESKRFVVHLPKQTEMSIEGFLKKVNAALQNMMTDGGKSEENMADDDAIKI